MRPPYMGYGNNPNLVMANFLIKERSGKIERIFVKTSFYSRRMDFLFAWAREKLSPSHEMECVR